MSDCTTNHARLVRLEGELHPSGKDYRCECCGEIVEVEVKPATISLTFGTGALPGCTAQAIEESGKWKHFDALPGITPGAPYIIAKPLSVEEIMDGDGKLPEGKDYD